MKKSIFILSILFISSCSKGIDQSENVLNDSVDWSNTNSCAVSIDDMMINNLLKKMTLEQKVGQIIMPDIDEVSPAEAKAYQLGTFLNGGGKFPNKNKNSSINDWKKLSKAYYDASPVVDGIVIPILWGTDAVHGHNNVIGATIFPHNIGLGSTMNPDLIKSIGEAVAKEVLSTGIPWTFAPTIAVPQNDLWGRTYEGYSENSELVSLLGKAMIIGLQGEGDEFLDTNHVLATAKHFLGDGGTKNGVDQGNTIISEQKLRDIHGRPYFDAINSCIQTVMASFNSWNGQKAHGSEYLLNNILRDQMGFKGLVVGDWNGHGQVPGCSKESCPESFNAGVDIFMAPDEWKLLYSNTLRQVKEGIISEERLNQAVKNILSVKYLLGMFDGRKPHEYPFNYIGDASHKDIARQAVRESIVLLKNNNKTLPISSNKHILVIGQSANKITKHMGGWTITWQGRENTNDEFPNSLSIFDAIKLKAESIGSTVEFSSNALYNKKPDLVIFVYGEDPYAEGDGDRNNLFYRNQDKYFKNYMEEINNQKISSVSLFISGRPLIINEELNLSDAFVQLWLPGSAIEGVTDVIFTDKENNVSHDFKGRLSYSWPKISSQYELNFGDENYDPLFEYKYGLTYKDNTFIDTINIEGAIPAASEVTLFVGSAYPSYREVISYFDASKNENIYEGISSDIFEHLKSDITISKFDFKKQDDAKTINFGNKDIFKSWEIASGSSEDLTYMNQGAIQLVIRPKKIGNQKISFNIACSKSQETIDKTNSSICYQSFDLSNNLSSNTLNTWQVIEIPLACLQVDNFDITSITSRASIATQGNWIIDVHSLKYINNKGYNACKITSENYE
ncbi:exo 1,3/1,4-beta-D-glucan glucohydrolase [Gammaproteobacteria bacterium]|nr:exo 1,3/1,4-beta-D-glucan glucohydrolase [Gammaproteobacteria bacterium]MDA8997687.1 exo 1,3/1,4-beta-D-glucan glucohydrolase [Gammaproteobacteria bacterium]MDA9220655.1 exo 1,3/1,4-beta-D-glucan glucohydrolase [Gammaproteobacteria bacterium]MDA9321312.1 exo 1,3/1,4-beta-D-glucan glucohydrolase [Gammaproteobacteria bacterium]